MLYALPLLLAFPGLAAPVPAPPAFPTTHAHWQDEKPPQDGEESPDGEESEEQDAEKKDADKIKRLTEWPKLEDKAGTAKEVQRLVKARTEEMGIDAAREIAKIGASAAPLLLQELGKTRDEDTAERITESLNAITGAAHTRLLAADFDHKKANVRRYALERVSYFPDAGTQKQAEAAYAKSLDKKSRWEPEDRYLAALCCAAAGSEKSWEDLVTAARKDWGKHQDDLSRTVPALRSDGLTRAVITQIASADRQDTVDALRLLSLCGTESGIDYVKPLLDSEDASIRVAAINACRGIVSGEPPLGKLSAFEAIELAKEWKAKL